MNFDVQAFLLAFTAFALGTLSGLDRQALKAAAEFEGHLSEQLPQAVLETAANRVIHAEQCADLA